VQENIQLFKEHVREISARPEFIHHKRFAKWHLEVVERIAMELCAIYPQADRETVEVMVWLHDYGKILDFDREYERELLDSGRDKLIELDFEATFANKVANYVELQDKNQEIDLRTAPIEVQIVASADGCSHFVGPFMPVHWYENPNKAIDALL